MTDEELVDALKALAHPVRLRILQALSGTERNVGEVDDIAAIGQPTLSQQLGFKRLRIFTKYLTILQFLKTLQDQ